VTAADSRWIVLEGTDNARDLGGLPVRGGAQTTFGRVYRSATLQSLTPSAIDWLRQRGVQTAVDLRSEREAMVEGSVFTETSRPCVLGLPVRSPPPTADDPYVLPSPGDWHAIAEFYLRFLHSSPQTIVAAITLAARSTVLYHCAAGKDRTGVVVALLLDAIGVERSAISVDYAMSTERLPQVRQVLNQSPGYRQRSAFVRGETTGAVDGRAMDEFLRLVDTRLGGTCTWLVANGMLPEALTALTSRLVQATDDDHSMVPSDHSTREGKEGHHGNLDRR